jgi:glycosyltransferase involved in cell wall biosynthesis
MSKISVVLATFNEEQNIKECLESVKGIADEIIIVDGTSSDNTAQIAKDFGARVILEENRPNFHINKQKAISEAKYEWILQLDADERVTKPLAQEILSVASMTNEEIESYENSLEKKDLFARHSKILESRDGEIGKKTGEYAAFFIPRLNFFLGKYLRHGGVYPDGVIRLIRNGKAHLPAKDVHEQMEVKGKVGWLQNDLLHKDSPTFARYLVRNSRYINLIAKDLARDHVGKNLFEFIKYMVILPLQWFLLTFIRHKGFMDSWQGFVFSLFSSLRFPRAYMRYLNNS